MNSVIFVSSDKISIALDEGGTQQFDISSCDGFIPQIGDIVNIVKSGDSLKITKLDIGQHDLDSCNQCITVEDIREAIYNKLGYRTKVKTSIGWSKDKIQNFIFGIFFIVLVIFIWNYFIK